MSGGVGFIAPLHSQAEVFPAELLELMTGNDILKSRFAWGSYGVQRSVVEFHVCFACFREWDLLFLSLQCCKSINIAMR